MSLLSRRTHIRTGYLQSITDAKKCASIFSHHPPLLFIRVWLVVADGIRNDSETYNEAILGYVNPSFSLPPSSNTTAISPHRMPPSQYITTILKPSTWGGAIELGILAAHYNTEIASIDVETSRIDFFTRGIAAAGMRCVLIYSGIHYDAATLAPMVDAPSEWHQTVFAVVSAG